MDIINIEPVMLKGEVPVPPSKSVAHRAIIAASLSGEECVISNVAMSKDILATLGCMKKLGAGFEIDAQGGRIVFLGKKKKALPKKIVLDCCESGSTLRFLMPVALTTGKIVEMIGQGRLMQRPQKPYFDLFSQIKIEYIQNDNSICLNGKLKNGLFRLPGNISSQFISGLLFALPLLEGDSEIEVTTHLESKGYVDLTLAVLRDFGIEIENKNYRKFKIAGNQKYHARDYCIEGDYSQAAFFLTAGALGCDIKCTGLNSDSLQGDKRILDILKAAGAEIKIDTHGAIQALRTAHMHGIEIDAREIPDLVPVLAVLCAFCKGESNIINAGRLRMKESDRLAAISGELKQLGANITERVDSLKIIGSDVLYGNTVSSWNDHRIAMSMAVAACRCEGEVLITGAKEAVKKSYPDFFKVYENLQKGPRPVIGFGEIITEDKL